MTELDSRIPLALRFPSSTPLTYPDVYGRAQQRRLRDLDIRAAEQELKDRRTIKDAFRDYYQGPEEGGPEAVPLPDTTAPGAAPPEASTLPDTTAPGASAPEATPLPYKPGGRRLSDMGNAYHSAFFNDRERQLIEDIARVNPAKAFEVEGMLLKRHETQFAQHRQGVERQYEQIRTGLATIDAIEGTPEAGRQAAYEEGLATYSDLYGPESVADLPQIYDPAVLAQKRQQLAMQESMYRQHLYGMEMAKKQLEQDLSIFGKVREQAALMPGRVEEARQKKEARDSVGLPTSNIQLAFLASGEGPRAEQARQALERLPEEERRLTIAHLAYLAEGTGKEAERANRALERIRELRQTGVRAGRGRRGRARGQAEEEQAPLAGPTQPETPTGPTTGFGGGWQPGQAGSGVKRFRRVR